MLLKPKLSNFNLDENLIKELEKLKEEYQRLSGIVILLLFSLSIISTIFLLNFIAKREVSIFILIFQGGLVGISVGLVIYFTFRTIASNFIFSISRKYKRMNKLNDRFELFKLEERNFDDKIFKIIESYNEIFKNENYILARKKSALWIEKNDIIDAYKYFFNSKSTKDNSYFQDRKEPLIENAGLLSFFINDNLAKKINEIHLKIENDNPIDSEERKQYHQFVLEATLEKEEIIKDIKESILTSDIC